MHIAIFGGTFCPIHNGHIGVAIFLQEHFQFDEFLFLPNKAPTLDKTTRTSVEQRLVMLELALEPYPAFIIDRREINRPTPSFMVDTLMSLREERGEDVSISLILGMDSFQQLHRWHDWQTILTLCNLIVINRPDTENKSLPKALEKSAIYQISDPKVLSSAKRGGFYRCNAGLYPISSTVICALIQSGGDAGSFLPPAVWTFIQEKNLFK
jgi:nicotinate-nucleotide adenylyltransferase